MKTKHLLFGLVTLSVVSLFIGVKDVTLTSLFALESDDWQIFLKSRVPRLISILIAGISLSVCGLIMQQLTRNKFVEPTTSGTIDSAKLGVLVTMLLFTDASPLVKLGVSFSFALLGTFLFMSILERVRTSDPIFIPLVGLMLGSVIGSITMFFAYERDLVQNLSSWLHGDFSLIVSGQYELLYLSIPLLAIAYGYASRFAVAGMGETFATNLGLNHKHIVNVGLVLVSLVSAIVILTVGTIPFLGLIVPNIVSLYHGDHLQKNLAQTALLGGIFVLACDVLGRILIFPYEISIGLMVGVIGSGTFLYLIVRRERHADEI